MKGITDISSSSSSPSPRSILFTITTAHRRHPLSSHCSPTHQKQHLLHHHFMQPSTSHHYSRFHSVHVVYRDSNKARCRGQQRFHRAKRAFLGEYFVCNDPKSWESRQTFPPATVDLAWVPTTRISRIQGHCGTTCPRPTFVEAVKEQRKKQKRKVVTVFAIIPYTCERLSFVVCHYLWFLYDIPIFICFTAVFM